MNIPLKYLSKMGEYDIQMDGVNIKAIVADHVTLVESGIAELKSRLGGDLKLVGIDLKKFDNSGCPRLLFIYVKDYCLIIDFNGLPMRYFPKILAAFLSDQTISFVGFEIDSKFYEFRNYRNFVYATISGSLSSIKGVEICDLAARVRKNRGLLSCRSFADLVTKCEFDFKVEDQKKKDPFVGGSAMSFSTEEIKYAMREAFNCYNMANKLLSDLLGNPS
ncbi:hypothetical protein ACH5RR_022833 [Cinchona calisaya]|uniref:3'-5' exonuclease domain-containing protein n=1 Tax=Cinchona calisaya TaxID=153742 RepID=A0ABD2Z8X4_9GENT